MMLLAASCLGWGAASGAGGVAGVWRIDVPKGSGVTLHSYLVLSEEGGVVSGSAYPNNSSRVPIEGVRREGPDVRFRIGWGWNFWLHPEGDRLRAVITYDGGGRDEAMAVRVDESALAPPRKIPPPAVRDLPDNGLARTPPMGWNNYNHFGEHVDDRLVRETADAMVSSGMAAAGYLYVNIDDTWEGGRDAAGNLVPNRKFPDMKALADYVHAKGLRFGIYSSPGPQTCGGYAGSYGHEQQDARTFAAWGVDYLKYDWCSADRIYSQSELRAVYQRMGEALQQTGRPIVFSLCEYGMGDVWTWGAKAGGNLWRTADDISDTWAAMAANGFGQARLARYTGPGRWSDPDMLEIGNGGMTAEEYRTQFSLWSLLAAPLIAGNDLRNMSGETLGILTNREVIAIDQDPAGRGPEQTVRPGGVEIWVRALADGSRAIGVFNRGETASACRVAWADAGLDRAPRSLRDLWRHAEVAPGDVDGAGVSVEVPAHGVVLLRAR